MSPVTAPPPLVGPTKTGRSFLQIQRLKQNTSFDIIKSVIDMVYVCDNCGALFSRASKQDHCPDCGKSLVRSANPVEQHEYASHLAELIRENCADLPQFPNIVETEISMINCFAFKLPATALQVDSGMVVEIMVEFGENAADQNDLTANVWARQENGVQMDFLVSLHLPARQKEPLREQLRRIFSALNENRTFQGRLLSFVTAQLKHYD
jgi:DNA-directed RNA polymerase subunit RPC12/RpoP